MDHMKSHNKSRVLSTTHTTRERFSSLFSFATFSSTLSGTVSLFGRILSLYFDFEFLALSHALSTIFPISVLL